MVKYDLGQDYQASNSNPYYDAYYRARKQRDSDALLKQERQDNIESAKAKAEMQQRDYDNKNRQFSINQQNKRLDYTNESRKLDQKDRALRLREKEELGRTRSRDFRINKKLSEMDKVNLIGDSLHKLSQAPFEQREAIYSNEILPSLSGVGLSTDEPLDLSDQGLAQEMGEAALYLDGLQNQSKPAASSNQSFANEGEKRLSGYGNKYGLE